jgi:Bacterial PH domain
MGALLLAAFSDLVSEELRGWLDLAPRGVLRIAAIQLTRSQRKTVYQEVWIPDLAYVLRGKESRPVTRLIRGMAFAISLLFSVRRGRYPDRAAPSGVRPAPATNEDVRQAKNLWESTASADSESQTVPPDGKPRRAAGIQPGEWPVLTLRTHPVVLVRPLVLLLLGLVIAILVSVSSLHGIGAVLVIIWLGWLILLAYSIWKIIGWLATYFVVTTQRIIISKGVLNTKTDTTSVGKVTNIGLSRSIAGRAIGYGELIFESGGNVDSARRIQHIPYPRQVYQVVARLI